MIKKTIGVIGLSGHALRLRNLLEPIANVTRLYHPSKSIDDPRCTQEFDHLLECDAVVIASPNETHFDYLMRLKDYKGYIFCEKPPAVTADQLIKLEDNGLNHSRLMVDYTYRYSSIAMVLSEALEPNVLGNIIGFSATLSNGLAFKPSYPGSWRATDKFSVIQTLGVHMIDLMIWMCNKRRDFISTIEQRSSILSCGPAFDTSRIIIKMNSGLTGDILVSYAMPLAVEVSVVGTNGTFHARDNKIIVRSPRDTFDNRGFFVTPPAIQLLEFNPETMYEEALANAVRYFIWAVETESLLEKETFKTCWAISGFK